MLPLTTSHLIYLFSILINLLLGFWVYSHGRRKRVNIAFLFFIFGIIGWLFTLFLYYTVTNPGWVLIIGRLNFAVVIIMLFFGLEFAIIFPKEISPLKKWKQTIILIETGLLFLITLLTPLIDKDEIIVGNLRETIYGSLYFLFILHFIFFVGLIIGIFIKKLRKFSGIARVQIYYIIWGLSLTAICGSITNILIPLFGYQDVANLGPLSTFFLVGSFSYAIVKYRLMDIRLVIGRTAIYIFSFLSVIGISFSLVFFNNRLFQPISFNILGPLIIVIAVLLFQFFFRFFEKLASRYFYYTFYSYQTVLTDLGEKLTKILDLKRLSSLIVDTLIKTMKLDRTVVLMREKSGHYAILRNIGFKEENGISLVKDNFLTRYLEKTKKPLVYGEISLLQRDTVFREEKENLEKLQENMRKIEANICLPLFRENKIIGIIILGKKISGDPFSQEDLELFNALSSQASIALENARLYDQVQDLSQNLQEKVDQQTRELQEAYRKISKAYRIEKKAHQELQELDEAKTQFVMATQHHLRSPLTIMKGYVSMLLEGGYGKINKKIREKLLFFQQSTEKLINLVNEFLDISQFRVGKGILNLANIKIEDLIKEIIKEVKPEADNKGIYLRLEKPKRLPTIQADPHKLKEAIYNIVDNGVKYTEKGGITIKLKTESRNSGTKVNEKLKIEISDTGIGMEKEEINTLFKETFERSKEAKRLYALGRGIGLYIASNIIKAHRGKIWVESPGQGKGSTFYIELLIK
jgi:signal transduction histidine kinase